MDPTASKQRVIVTCNGGSGTDWNVVQNWSGTYGGDPDNYAEELKNQQMNGEYGAWRSVDLHTEGGFDQDGVWSEDRMYQLMEKKVRLGETVREHAIGQFQWIFNSHDNPGRRHPDEGYRVIDKVGPVNYKGLFTTWGEPLDVYYMYRANYASPESDPMIYIVSHTWSDRWSSPGVKDGIRVFSNCEEVELFNDVKSVSLGRKKRGAKGTHFIWNKVDIKYNVLYAVGYVDGKPVAEDCIVLDHLPESPGFGTFYDDADPILKGEEWYHYIYRVNSGGDAYRDEYGQVWSADIARTSDKHWGSTSWADQFEHINRYQGSQRYTGDPIKGTRDWKLFGQFRYGRHELAYHFPLPDGEYRVELFFTEPWYGTGGIRDGEGYRVFDVALNDSVYIRDLDIWAESGHDCALKQVLTTTVQGGKLKISFPQVKAGQALISAIAIASRNQDIRPADPPPSDGWSWSNIEKVVKTPVESLPAGDDGRQAMVYPAEDAKIEGEIEINKVRDRVSLDFTGSSPGSISWDVSTGVANIYAFRFSYMNVSDSPKEMRFRLVAADGTTLKDDLITFPVAPEKWRTLSTSTDGFINAGHYRVILSSDNMKGLNLNSLTVQ